MKRMQLIYNPHSGKGSFETHLHECIDIFRDAGYETQAHRTVAPGDIELCVAGLPKDYYDAIAVSGGDGTLNIAVNAMIRHGLNIPLLIIPTGTANDFASALKIPKDIKEAAALINNAPAHYDAGVVNGRHFLNVCAAGFLADISQTVNKELKNSLGNLAYYLTGLSKLTNLTPIRVRVTNSQSSFEEDIYLFLALNSTGIGGFSRLSPGASVCDGLFDFIVVKAVSLLELGFILVKLLAGEHINDSNIIFFQDSYAKIEPLFDGVSCLNTDIDGEAGPQLPIVIENRRHALRVFAPENQLR